MLSDTAVKLQEGLSRLAQAGDDEGLLGLALISLHGALEEHFREQLAREIVAETQSRPSWLELVELWQKHRYLSAEDRALILTTNSKRNRIAHGDSYDLSRAEVERYAEFVRKFTGVRARPSRRWGIQEEAVMWEGDSGVGTMASPLQTSLAGLRPLGHRLRGQRRWMAKMVIAAAVALVSFWFWNSWLVSVGITAVILYLIHHRSWLRAGYVYVGGLVFGYGTGVLGVATAVAFLAALLWPLAAGFWYLTGGTLELPQTELVVPTIERLEEVIGVEELEEEATAVPTETPLPTPPTIQIQVQGNSNVRAEPNTAAAVLTIVTNGEIYDVLDVNADRTWYKIQLESGQEGWIGSSRVIEITP